jgi:hypothetical protein
MTAPVDAPCQPWATVEDATACIACSDLPTGTLSDCIDIASAWLWRLTGRIFGVCQITVYPLGGQICCPPTSGWITLGSCYWFDRTTNCWWDVYGRRGRGEGVPEIKLGFENVQSIVKVCIDGAPLDPSSYRVDDYRWLVRTDGQTWPAAPQNSLLTSPPGFSVTLTHGIPIPPDGVTAAATLACELARSCQGDKDCRLPKRITQVTRQGVSMIMLDPTSQLAQGRFGVTEIDSFLQSVNPKGIDRRASVTSPDMRRSVRIPTSPLAEPC